MGRHDSINRSRGLPKIDAYSAAPLLTRLTRKKKKKSIVPLFLGGLPYSGTRKGSHTHNTTLSDPSQSVCIPTLLGVVQTGINGRFHAATARRTQFRQSFERLPRKRNLNIRCDSVLHAGGSDVPRRRKSLGHFCPAALASSCL